MIEIWRSLLKPKNGLLIGSLNRGKRIDERISHYFKIMFGQAKLKMHCMAIQKGKPPDYECIQKWVAKKRGDLNAGLYVSRYLERNDKYPIDATGNTNNCILEAAKTFRETIKEGCLPDGVSDRMPDWKARWNEINNMFHMCLDGLRWNEESNVFEIKDEYATS